MLNTVLLPAMKDVGDRFGAGELILPFVLQSAEVMKKAVAHLEHILERQEGYTKGKIVLATVFGDVHDIGKNLVNTILSNNGYTVYDLGKQVPLNTIVEKAVEVNADAIGLSALLDAVLTRVTKGVRKAGKTLKDAERRRLARRSAAPTTAKRRALPPGWAVVRCDGGSRGNPGPAAYAFVHRGRRRHGAGIGRPAIGVATAGTAEYRAVAEGLEAAAGLGLDGSRCAPTRAWSSATWPSGAAAAQPGTRRAARPGARRGRPRSAAVKYRWVPRRRTPRATRSSAICWFEPPAREYRMSAIPKILSWASN